MADPQYWVAYSYGGQALAWVTILNDPGIAAGLESRLGVPAPMSSYGAGAVVVAWAPFNLPTAGFPLFATFFAADIDLHFRAAVQPDFGVIRPSDGGAALVAMWQGAYGFGNYYVPFPG
jgi:hypothetical protein